MRKVLILLSTYNGEKFLTEQLDSLYAQINVDIHILVRDDGSKDSTLSILKRYCYDKGRMTILNGENIGAGFSFYELIKEAEKNYPDYDYYAFCDQDDVWFKDKVAKGVAALEKSESNIKLFFSGSIITDSSLHPRLSSSINIVNSFGANLIANRILGCEMIFNFALLHEINKINTLPYSIPNGKIPIHDGWTAFVSYALNADVIQSTDSMMYYRQHGDNVVGAGMGFLSTQKNRVNRYLFQSTHGKANKCIIGLQVLGDSIPPHNKQLMQLVATYRNNIFAKIKLLVDRRMYEYGWVDNIGTFLTIIFNKF